MAASTVLQRLPPPPALRLVTIPTGTLLGFKACPGPDGARLLHHASTTSGDTAAWSGIYVQLSLAQAVSYVPNQYDRGETTCSVCQIATKRPLQIAISDDPVMARAGVSSSDKARRVLLSVRNTPELDWETPSTEKDDELVIVAYFGAHDHSLCLVDCENYELAVPHALFTSDHLDLDPILVLERSTAIPGGVIGRMDFLPEVDTDASDSKDSDNESDNESDNDNDNDNGEETPKLVERKKRRAAHQQLPLVRASELADASSLGPMLEERFLTHQLLEAVRVEWFSLPEE